MDVVLCFDVCLAAELYAMRGPGVHYAVAPPLPVRACLNEVRVAEARGYVYGSPRLCRSPLSVLWSVLVLGTGRTIPAGRRSWSPPLIPRPHAFDMGSSHNANVAVRCRYVQMCFCDMNLCNTGGRWTAPTVGILLLPLAVTRL